VSGNIRLEIRQLLVRHQFPKSSVKNCEVMILRAIRQARLYRKKLPKDYWCPITRTYMPYKVAPRGRSPNELRIRMLIMHALFRTWRYAFGEKPVINNRDNNPRPFTLFAEDVFIGESIANTEDNLEHYRSYILRILKIFSKRGSVISTMI
jgi:hypothetical protein